MTNKAKQIQAFKELLKISYDRSFDVYETSGYRSWPVEWNKELCAKYKTPEDKQKALDETLMRLTRGNFPKTVKQMEKERKVIRLTLLAGANPNYSDSYHGSVFDSFWYSKKGYGLAELVKDDRFETPIRLQEFYKNFGTVPIDITASDEEFLRNKKENKNRIDLIYTLFQKGMYPQSKEAFERWIPVILEKDPEFFNKKKELVVSQMKRAKTPVQIFNALWGRKEKN